VPKEIDEDDVLPELDELDSELPGELTGETEEVGIDDGQEIGAGEIDDAPEDVGLDVETLGGLDDGDESFLDEGEEPSARDDSTLSLDDDLDEEEDEDGWTNESEGTGAAFDEELEDDDDEASPADDGGLEGMEDPTLDDIAGTDGEEGESSFSIEGEDLSADEELDRVELDLE
jgi:hypothetical protein